MHSRAFLRSSFWCLLLSFWCLLPGSFAPYLDPHLHLKVFYPKSMDCHNGHGGAFLGAPRLFAPPKDFRGGPKGFRCPRDPRRLFEPEMLLGGAKAFRGPEKLSPPESFLGSPSSLGGAGATLNGGVLGGRSPLVFRDPYLWRSGEVVHNFFLQPYQRACAKEPLGVALVVCVCVLSYVDCYRTRAP